jgi:hypothetical protein
MAFLAHSGPLAGLLKSIVRIDRRAHLSASDIYMLIATWPMVRGVPRRKRM